MSALRATVVFLGLGLCLCDDTTTLFLLQQSANLTLRAGYEDVMFLNKGAKHPHVPVVESSSGTVRSFARELDTMKKTMAWTALRENPYRLLASRKRKLLFCSIFKNAATEFMSVMMRAEGLDDTHWNPGRHGVAEDSVHNDPAREVLLFSRTDVSSVNELNAILNGSAPGWIRALVLRDPVERLASAWLSKVKNNKRTGQTPLTPPTIPQNTSLEDMIALLESHGDLTNADPHLRPQNVQCGLTEAGSLERFDVIGMMNSVAIDTREMLTAAGGREFAKEMLSTGWGSNGTQPLFTITRSERERGNGNAMESGGTQELMKSLEPGLIARIKKLYAADIELIKHASSIRATRSHLGF